MPRSVSSSTRNAPSRWCAPWSRRARRPRAWDSMVALDWPALAIPEEYGGVGLGFVEMAVVVEELGRAVAPGPLLATVTQFAPMVREAGHARATRALLVRRGRRRRPGGGAGRPPPGLVAGRRHHAADSRGRLGPQGHQVRGLGRPRRRRGRRGRSCRRRRGRLRRAAPSRPAPVHSLDASRPSRPPLDRVSVPATVPWASPAARRDAGIAAPSTRRRGTRARDGRRLRHAVPDGAGVREGPQAVRRPRRLVPGDEAQDEQHVPRGRAGPLALLFRRRRHQRGRAGTGDGGRHGQGRQRRLPAAGLPRLDPVLRWHRFHLGARLPPLREAGGERRRVFGGAAEHSVAVAGTLGLRFD